jgi:hypothetical protein
MRRRPVGSVEDVKTIFRGMAGRVRKAGAHCKPPPTAAQSPAQRIRNDRKRFRAAAISIRRGRGGKSQATRRGRHEFAW